MKTTCQTKKKVTIMKVLKFGSDMLKRINMEIWYEKYGKMRTK